MEKKTIFGTPITPIKLLDQLQGEAFCISYWNRNKFSDSDLQRYIATAGELLLDNGAFSAWNAGVECDDEYWADYIEWANAIIARHPNVWAIVPDSITGAVEENYRLVEEFSDLGRFDPINNGTAHFWDERACPVWHLHEPLEYLAHYVAGYHRIAFGSSGEYAKVGTPEWHARVEEALAVVQEGCESQGDTRSSRHVHILRAQSQHYRYDFDSSDSTNLATNHCRYKREGGNYVRRFADRLIDKVAA